MEFWWSAATALSAANHPYFRIPDSHALVE